MTNPASIKVKTTIITPDQTKETCEHVAIETPYKILLNDEEIGSSMVLPTALEEFAVGFLFGQGYLAGPEEIKEILVCPEGRISVYADVDKIEPKETIISSGCGGTGKISREMLEGTLEPPHDLSISFTEIRLFIRAVLRSSNLGPLTHCTHGCGLWAEGSLQTFYEDVGRHNAVDKTIGAILLGRAPARAAMYTTGRLTSDMVLKCARIRIPILISRTSTSSLGHAIAERAGLTLAAYARPGRINVFHGAQRIRSNESLFPDYPLP
ncbi:MAG: formate dehydrogenase family accessory protein FdhD [Desulfobacterales bacterium]|nr:MAG: formate dehydrogenase family accessory protein FdhD [Desulfobacterales bacterium]